MHPYSYTTRDQPSRMRHDSTYVKRKPSKAYSRATRERMPKGWEIDAKQPPQRACSRPPLHPGDLAKMLIIALCIGFLVLILLHDKKYGNLRLFSESYLQDGFCLTNRHKAPGWDQGHLLAFYADTFMAVIMSMMAYVGSDTFSMSQSALRPIRKNAISLFGHGCGHLFLGIRTIAKGRADRVFEDLTSTERLIALLLLYPVWIAFMRDKSRSLSKTMLLATFHNILQVYFLPTRFFFTHVLKAVLVGSAIRWLMRPRGEKSKYYTYEAWLVDVPILVMTYFEAVTCDSFLVHYGGHVFFDLVVPFGFIVYFSILIYEGDFTTSEKSKSMKQF